MVSARYIEDGVLRGQFNRDMAYYVRLVLEDVRNGIARAEDALKKIQALHRELQPNFEYAKGVIGLRAAFYQFSDGRDLCRTRAGCVVGGPMMAHGINNFWENGLNLWTGRSDTTGPVRWLYRSAAGWMGKDPVEGDIAYGYVDVALSGVSLLRPVPKKDAWKLFKYMDSDKQRAYERTGKAALLFDALSTGVTIRQLIEDLQEKPSEDSK